jgi:epoxyqueuosine reductase
LSLYQEIVERITELVLNDPGNRLEGEVRFFDPPLVGVAAAADPLFNELKKEEGVGPMHRLPEEWLPGAKAVISYFLPFSGEIRRSNYQSAVSESWIHGRFRGEQFNDRVREVLVGLMKAWGGRGVAPLLEGGFVIDNERYRSSWSERHAAYIAGLGTFSLNRGLITAKGMAGRFGSIITNLALQPTPRDYDEVFQYCPWMQDRSCGACIERCPSGAITAGGKDKHTCSQYLLFDNQAQVLREKFGFPYLACGKCQTGVPCEERAPEL